ncbi:uncharacterized protein G2W53_022808 [Senna tora]|uniref:Uncharacterized protein n=1 Tax=Senna tora TaxID=362788 RepID=A0A834TNH0_9FABA|nr:uncharacterized protein G2W53_022808 [Senna tora]
MEKHNKATENEHHQHQSASLPCAAAGSVMLALMLL